MSTARNNAAGFDKHLNVFSPDGRLFQIGVIYWSIILLIGSIEYAFKAVTTASILAIAVRGTESVVVACQKRIRDRLMNPDDYTNLHRINERVGACFVGYAADCKHMALRSKYYAAEYKSQKGFEIPSDILCRKLAAFAQGCTQVSGARILACSTLIIGIDPEYGTMLYKTDPAGFVCGFRAVAIGAKDRDANIFLEKKMKKKLPSTREETINLALLCLGQTLGIDYKAREVEVGEVSFVNPEFRVLPDEEVDQILTAISERD